MKIPRFIRYFLWTVLIVLALLVITVVSLKAYFNPKHTLTSGVVYGHRNGRDLLMEVARPEKPNGAAILFLISGGWKSPEKSFQPWTIAPLLRHGYTVFAVYHVSQPDASVMEIVEDINRAVRYVRHNATNYNIDSQRIGISGASAGGHLSLMLATRGGPGDPDAADPVDRESSAVEAVAIFFPVTDLLNLGASTENPGDGGPPKHFIAAFGPQSTNLAVWKVTGHEMSPIYYVKSNLPPTLIFHGDADTLVPLDQSQRYVEAVRKEGGTIELVVHKKGSHGWPAMLWDVRRFADWYDKYLPAKPAP